MHTLGALLENFFTHKDFLPPAGEIAGTMFTPLHIVFALIMAAITAVACVFACKCTEKGRKRIFAAIWLWLVVLEFTKIIWETVSGKTVNFEWGGMLPLYPCSIFMYAMPFAIWGKGLARKAACGYVCSLGLLGGLSTLSILPIFWVHTPASPLQASTPSPTTPHWCFAP